MEKSASRRARHSDPTLMALEQLYATMNSEATSDQREAWWGLVLRVQSSIESDGRAPKAEHDAMRRLREGVSQVYSALNRGQEASYSAGTRAIIGLQYLLEARTTGFDGRRLR